MADWVKLTTNMFDNKTIKQIEVAPKGKQMLLLWVRLICLAGTINDGGRVYVTKGVPYTNKGLAVELNESVAVVDAAMKLFREYKMIDIDEEHGLYLVGSIAQKNYTHDKSHRMEKRYWKDGRIVELSDLGDDEAKADSIVYNCLVRNTGRSWDDFFLSFSTGDVVEGNGLWKLLLPASYRQMLQTKQSHIHHQQMHLQE